MHFGGLIRFTLADFPGRSAAILFTRGCNLRCRYCHNPDLALGTSGLIDEALVWDFLKRRRRQLDGVVVSGGEPTLQADLPEVCRRIQELGFAVKLDTNGLRPAVLAGLLERRLVDYVALDVKAPLDRYLEIAGAPGEAVAESIRILADSPVEHEFRTTVVRPLLEVADLVAIADLIRGKGRWWLQDFSPENTLDPTLAREGRAFNEGEKLGLELALSDRPLDWAWRGAEVLAEA